MWGKNRAAHSPLRRSLPPYHRLAPPLSSMSLLPAPQPISLPNLSLSSGEEGVIGKRGGGGKGGRERRKAGKEEGKSSEGGPSCPPPHISSLPSPLSFPLHPTPRLSRLSFPQAFLPPWGKKAGCSILRASLPYLPPPLKPPPSPPSSPPSHTPSVPPTSLPTSRLLPKQDPPPLSLSPHPPAFSQAPLLPSLPPL